jgi:hypothetical protein
MIEIRRGAILAVIPATAPALCEAGHFPTTGNRPRRKFQKERPSFTLLAYLLRHPLPKSRVEDAFPQTHILGRYLNQLVRAHIADRGL